MDRPRIDTGLPEPAEEYEGPLPEPTAEDFISGDVPKAQQETEARVEEIREMLRLGYYAGEIKREIAKKYRLTAKYVGWNLLPLARKRNLLAVDKPQDEMVAETVGYWRRIVQDSAVVAKVAMGELGIAGKAIQKSNQVIISGVSPIHKNVAASESEMAEARDDLSQALKLEDQARRKLYTARKDGAEAMREIQNLLGLRAPMKIANVTTDGKDVNRPASLPEPVDEAALSEEISGLFKAIEDRGSNEGL